MPALVEITQGQTFPFLTVPLVPASGVHLLPTDGAAAFFEIRPVGGGPLLGGQATINDDGTVTYAWQTTDVLLPGIFWIRWRITYAAGSPEEVTEYVPPGKPDMMRVYPWGPGGVLTADVYVQMTTPVDDDGDYIWFVTDSGGSIIDIRTGVNTDG